MFNKKSIWLLFGFACISSALCSMDQLQYLQRSQPAFAGDCFANSTAPMSPLRRDMLPVDFSSGKLENRIFPAHCFVKKDDRWVDRKIWAKEGFMVSGDCVKKMLKKWGCIDIDAELKQIMADCVTVDDMEKERIKKCEKKKISLRKR